MRNRKLQLLLPLLAALLSIAQGSTESSDLKQLYIPLSVADSRATIMLSVAISSPNVCAHTVDDFYLIPIDRASKEEILKDRAVGLSGYAKESEKIAFGHGTAVCTRGTFLDLEITCERYDRSATIEYAASFSVPIMKNEAGIRASISYEIMWRKLSPETKEGKN